MREQSFVLLPLSVNRLAISGNIYGLGQKNDVFTQNVVNLRVS